MLLRVSQCDQRKMIVGFVSSLRMTGLVKEAKGVNGLRYWKWDDIIF